MPNKKFLEEYPLYRKFKSDLKYFHSVFSGMREDQIPRPAIHMYCPVCKSDQTFNMENQYYVSKLEPSIINGKVKRMDYICSACNQGLRVFLVHFTSEQINKSETRLVLEKVGQIPPWSIEMDKELEKMLGEYAEYYRRGLICESQSYGIGAYAYFRRITEDVIDELLESIFDLVEEDGKEEYKEKLEQVKKEKIAENKIKVVKDLLPKSLQVDGTNPLKELYGVLSQGIHDETDEVCMEKAEAIRGILVFLVNQVMRTKRDRKSFIEGMKKILRKEKT